MLNTSWSLCQPLHPYPYLPAHTEIISSLRRISIAAGFTGAVILWLCLVRILRWRRYNAIHRKFGARWNNGHGKITPQEAQEIMHVSCIYDMPWLVSLGGGLLVFLNTYGIPSMSKLFVATKELLSKDTIQRRFSDTDILISTWQECPLSGFIHPSSALKNKGQESKPANDPRANIAIARVNWIHSKYKILCTDRYGWRRLSPLEKEAYYVFWAEVGRRLNIQGIPSNMEGMITWRTEYERTHKIPAQTNKNVARATINEVLESVPKGCKTLVERFVLCLIDDCTRQALMYERPPLVFYAIVAGLFNITALVQRFFLLPRFSGRFMIERGPPRKSESGDCARMHPLRYTPRPWYKAEPTYALGYYWDLILVKLRLLPEMPSQKLKSAGYRIEELGPIKWEQEGHEEVMKNASGLLGCPITGPWSLEERKAKS
ncbi:hypothetical protein HYPSUDRAFT_147542 [Hypholoma sublateritium FD-334 SS-4]|uniref:ER-bound oxygenase mpaB/mpaB'/Rubber oxygenase catalytic domain-containing protein n=1 Tax=Hypholoma sublateritium (strain FD-334 SS-4) TaxID=945553 RepID=A0A0D2KPP8_HYPSF|nr:hypothetical protein HYPSUDRAFT_147542 [Hypholoma sublateritium FD-334 SS-4]